MSNSEQIREEEKQENQREEQEQIQAKKQEHFLPEIISTRQPPTGWQGSSFRMQLQERMWCHA